MHTLWTDKHTWFIEHHGLTQALSFILLPCTLARSTHSFFLFLGVGMNAEGAGHATSLCKITGEYNVSAAVLCAQPVPQASPRVVLMRQQRWQIAHSLRERKFPSLTYSCNVGSKEYLPYRPPLSFSSTACSRQWQTPWMSFWFLMLKILRERFYLEEKTVLATPGLLRSILQCFIVFHNVPEE